MLPGGAGVGDRARRGKGDPGVRGAGRACAHAAGARWRRRRGGGGAQWRERIRAGLAALLEFLDDEPGLGGLCVVDTLSACPRALERRAEIVRGLVDAVDAGRREARAGLAPTRLTAEGVVGGVLGVLYSALRRAGPQADAAAAEPADGDDRAALPRPHGRGARDRAAGAEGASAVAAPGEQPAGGPRHAPHLPHGAGARRDRRAREREQPSGRRSLRRAGPGPDLEAAHAPGAPRADRERRRRGPARGEPNAWRLTPAAARSSTRSASRPTPAGG